MYNEEVKNRYLQYNKKAKPSMFEEVAAYEDSKKKDICLMSQKEVLSYLFSIESLVNSYDIFRKLNRYFEWCRAVSECDENVLSEISKKNYISRYYMNHKDFYISESLCKQYILQLKHSNYGVYLASFIRAVYEGIAGDQYVNLKHLKVRDIDKENCTVNLYDGKVMSVSKELVKMLIQTSTITRLDTVRPVPLKGSLYYDSIWMLQSADATEKKYGRRFLSLLKNARDICQEPQLNKITLEKSGYFNNIMNAMAKDGITKDELLSNLEQGKEGYYVNSKYRKYFQDDAAYVSKGMVQFMNDFHSYIKQY